MSSAIQLNGESIAKAAMETPAQKKVDKLVQSLSGYPQVEMPLKHRFTPGLYTREIFMPRGTLVVSKIHKTRHPFVCLKGHAAVWVEGEGVVHIQAGHIGITEPGTRRILYMHQDTVWVTFHPTNKTELEEIEKDVIYTPAPVNFKMVDQDVMMELTKPC